MNDSKISVRYAKALFSLAEEKAVLDKIYQDMHVLYTVCRQVKNFLDFLENPVIKPSEKKNFFKDNFREYLHELSMEFINLIIKNNRESYLERIVFNFINSYKKYKGVKTVTLTSAYKLDDDLQNAIIKQIEKGLNAEIEIHPRINKKILGGFILRVDDKQYDASISRQLEVLKNEIADTGL
mgnify:CR=1 FL=1